MKRHGDLWARVIDHANLYAAYLEARKHKRSTHACLAFEKRIGAQLDNLHRTLADGSYQPRPYTTFTIHEPKPRVISAPAFRDRVVQHAVYRVVQPIFDRSFIDQSFACRPGKGTHAAADYAQHALQHAPRGSYVLQLDIRKFYYRIDRGVLRALLARKIKDTRLLDLMMTFARQDAPLGIPIGNLLSQLYGLIYLNPLDHFIKRELRARLYCRYVDDFVLFGLTRAQALSHRERIVDFLRGQLRLELSKSTLAPITRGANFVGYRTWASRRFIRRRALFNFRRSARACRVQSVVSSLGHARRTASHRYMIRFLKEHHHAVHRALPESLRRLHRVHPARAA